MVSNPSVSKQRQLALVRQIDEAVKLLSSGLGELQGISAANDFYHHPFLLLSSGLERLMKCMICLKTWDDTGGFPTTEDIRGHDLVVLQKRVLRECMSKSTAYQQPATRADYDYMAGDSGLLTMLEILSEFGKRSRYHNLDVVTDSKKPSPDPKKAWDKYEMDLARGDPHLSGFLKDPTKADELQRGINRLIVGRIERFARALARQFTLGDLGQCAKVHTATIGCFLRLQDDELGTSDYRDKA